MVNHQWGEYFYFFSDDVKADVVLLPLSNEVMNNKSLVMLNCVSWASHCERRMVGFGSNSKRTPK